MVTVYFKYEKLPNYCFICGVMGHVNRTCDIRFEHPDGEVLRLWDVKLRTPPRLSTQPRGGARWLVEEHEGKHL